MATIPTPAETGNSHPISIKDATAHPPMVQEPKVITTYIVIVVNLIVRALISAIQNLSD